MSHQSPESPTRRTRKDKHVMLAARDVEAPDDGAERQKEAVEHGMMLKSSELEQRIDVLEPESEILKDKLKKLVARLTGLKTSVNSLQKHAKTANARLDELEPGSLELTQSVDRQQQELSELGQLGIDMKAHLGKVEDRAEVLEQGITGLSDRSRELKVETAELSQRAVAMSGELGSLLNLTDNLAERALQGEERLDTLEALSEALHTSVEALRGVTGELAEMDQQQGEAIDALGTRLDSAQHDHAELNRSHERLSGHTEELGNRLGLRFRQAAWTVGGVAVVLAIVAATAHWRVSGEDFGPQIQPLVSQLANVEASNTDQQRDLSQLSQELNSLHLRLDEPVAADPAIEGQLQGMDKRLQALDSRFDTELAAIREDLSSDNDTLGAPVDLATIAGAGWLQAQPADHYVIQLGGVYGKRALSEEAGRLERLVNKEELSWFQTVYRGRDWFVLLHGNYASFDEAFKAMEALPEVVRTSQPYIRNFGGVRKSMR